MKALEELDRDPKKKKPWKSKLEQGIKLISSKKDDKDEKVNCKVTQERGKNKQAVGDEKIQV